MKITIEIELDGVGEAGRLIQAMETLARDGNALTDSPGKKRAIADKTVLTRIGWACQVVTRMLATPVIEAKLPENSP